MMKCYPGIAETATSPGTDERELDGSTESESDVRLLRCSPADSWASPRRASF